MAAQSVYIIPGWSEGAGQTRKLAACLINNGFTQSKKVEDADILITHSAGCYFAAEAGKAKLVMLINPSYGLGGAGAGLGQVNDTLFGAPRQIRQWGFINWLQMRSWNAYYLLSQPHRSLKILKYIKSDPVSLPGAEKIIFLDNDSDRDHTSAVEKVRAAHKNVVYIPHPGLHEDCWINPQPYVDLLHKEYNK